MHFCKAKIAIADDMMNVYSATEFDPVSWPEIQVLQFLHGETAVTEVEPFASTEQNPREERQRLSEKYREIVVAEVFGGRQAPNEMEAPGVHIRPGITWMNPLTRQVEITAANGKPKPNEPEPTPEEPDEPDEPDEPAAPPRVGGRFTSRK